MPLNLHFKSEWLILCDVNFTSVLKQKAKKELELPAKINQGAPVNQHPDTH